MEVLWDNEMHRSSSHIAVAKIKRNLTFRYLSSSSLTPMVLAVKSRLSTTSGDEFILFAENAVRAWSSLIVT